MLAGSFSLSQPQSQGIDNPPIERSGAPIRPVRAQLELGDAVGVVRYPHPPDAQLGNAAYPRDPAATVDLLDVWLDVV